MDYLCATTNKVHSFFEKTCPDLLAGDSSIVLAISGGPDSMAMLNIINQIAENSKLEPFNIFVAHLNHCLRNEESDQDAFFVLEQCKKYELNCVVKRIDINKLAKQNGQSIETAARNTRYEFLKELCRDHNCKYLATAHHADDNAETILHRIIRGTGIKGLSGVQPDRYADDSNDITIVRPLLDISRSQIEQYLTENNIPSRHDSSNDSNDYTRNSLRNKLIPEIEKNFNPNLKLALNNLGAIAAEASELLNILAQNDIESAKGILAPGLFQIPIHYINSIPISRSGNLLRYAFDNIGIPMADIGFSQIDHIRNECKNEKTRIIAKLPGDWNAEISDGNLIIASFFNIDYQSVELNIPGITKLDILHSIDDYQAINSITTELIDAAVFNINNFRNTKIPSQEIIDLDKISGPLYAAPLKTAISFQPLGLSGTQTTGDIMTNCKVPQYLRNRIAAIYDDSGIICIAGHRIAERVKFTSKTKNAAMLSFI